MDTGAYMSNQMDNLIQTGINMKDEIDRLRAECEMSRETLRDKFAMAILAGSQTLEDGRTFGNRPAEYDNLSVEEWQLAILRAEADYCYKLADVMLEVREQKRL